MSDPPVKYAGPTPFTLRQRVQLAVLPPVLAALMKLSFLWCRSIEVRRQDELNRLLAAGTPVFLAFWHESMAIAARVHQGWGAHTLTSHSYDGELAARVVRRFGLRAARGSSSRGGSEAIGQLLEALRVNPMIGFTLDGPRGPRREAKPGAAILAARSGACVIPNAYAVDHAWRLRSWDRFPIPKPGARIVCTYGPAIPPPPDDHPDTVRDATAAIESALNTLHREVERELGHGEVPG